MTLKIYPASSWRNPHYLAIVDMLRADGHELYDWRTANGGFRWPCTTWWEFIDARNDPQVKAAYQRDEAAIDWCDVLVLIRPCGISAHMEAMDAAKDGRHVIVVFDPDEPFEPAKCELMYLLLAGAQFVLGTDELRAALRAYQQELTAQSERHQLAEQAMALAHGDVAEAIRILQEWTDLSDATAFAAIDEACLPDCDDGAPL